MTKRELVAAMAARTGLTQRDAGRALAAMTEVVGEALYQGDKVTLLGFGTFDHARRSAFQTSHPRTGQRLTVPARRYATFRPGTKLRRAVCPSCPH